MRHLPQLIADLALINNTTGLTAILFKWMKQPVVLGCLLLFAPIACQYPTSSTTRIKDSKSTIFNRQQLLAIKNVNIITMSLDSQVIEQASILIQDNKILSINEDIPASAVVIDAEGKWLIPGLIDMHVHIPTDGHFNTNYPTRSAAIFTNTQDVMTPFIANGVTTVFELNSRAGHFGQRNEILRGDVIGPRMALAAMINGGDGSGRIANTPQDGRQAVRLAKAEGYEFIKVYSALNAETYAAIINEAEILSMKVIGHIPNTFKGKIEAAFVPHFGMVAHAEEFFKQIEEIENQSPRRLAQLAKENKTWVCPTLFIIASVIEQSRSLQSLSELPELQYVHPLLQSKWMNSNQYNKSASQKSIARLEKMNEFNLQLVKALKQEGVPIVAGTDAGTSGVIWGFSLLNEIELLVNAGLTPTEALASATRLPATWLGIDSLVGTITAGKYADLVLLEENPLKDISHIRKIAGVFINGHWMDKSTIDKMLKDLATRNQLVKQQWDWNKRADY